MDYTNTVTMIGDVVVTLSDSATGIVKCKREIKNLVVQSGKEFIASRMLDATAWPINAMGIGSGTGTAVSTDTTLQAELARALLYSTSKTANVVTYAATFPAGVGTGAITEAGLFNNEISGGTMLARTVFPVVNKLATDQITIQWNITIQ